MMVTMKQILPLFVFGIAMIGCGQESSKSQLNKAITDNEFVKTSVVQDSRLKESVGQLLINGTQICHAFATGPNEVTTAGHCVSALSASDAISFQSASGKKYTLSTKSVNDKADVAVLKSQEGFQDYLEKNLGYANSILQSNKLLTIENNQLIAQENSSLFRLKGYEGIAFHQYDTRKGNSGAPLLDENNRVIGMHVGADFNANVNVVIEASVFESSNLDVQRIFDLESLEELEKEIKKRQCIAKHCLGDGFDKLECYKICEKIASEPNPKDK